MPRRIFGGEVTHLAVAQDAGNGNALVVAPGAVMPWRLTPGGTVQTDFLLWDGSAYTIPATSIVADSAGYPPAFQGPDNVSVLYDPGGRALIARDAYEGSGGGGAALDDDLAAIAALPSAANKVPYATGPGTWAMADLSPFARTLLDDTTATVFLATLSIDLTKIDALSFAVGGVYPTRATITTNAARRVRWVGATPPTIGGAYAISGFDVWEETP